MYWLRVKQGESGRGESGVLSLLNHDIHVLWWPPCEGLAVASGSTGLPYLPAGGISHFISNQVRVVSTTDPHFFNQASLLLTVSLCSAGLASACPLPGPMLSTWAALSPYSLCRASAQTSTCVCATSTVRERASECKAPRWSTLKIRTQESGHAGGQRVSHQEEGWHGLQDFGPQSDSLHSMLSESSQIHQPTTCSFFVFCLRLIISYVSSQVDDFRRFSFVFSTLWHVVWKFDGLYELLNV